MKKKIQKPFDVEAAKKGAVIETVDRSFCDFVIFKW